MNLEDIISKDKIRYNEPMKNHTTMKVGGPADILVIPETVEEIINVVKYAKENNIKLKVLGFGSNVVVEDEGIEGIVIKITNKLESIKIEDEYVTVSLGASMPKTAMLAKKHSLTGFEFACGIPGTIGGGIRMNAGAYGSEISDVLVSAKFLDENLEVKELSKEQLEFGYRKSLFGNNKKLIVLEGTFKLAKGDLNDITRKMKENQTARSTKQPLEYPNAGSIFKRPVGHFAGKLIQDAGMQGVSVGGAMVSTKHAGFIINTGDATSKDIHDLIKLIQKNIKEKFDVEIKTEVEFIGRD